MEIGIGFLLKKTVAYFLEPFGMVLVFFSIGIYFLFRGKMNYAKLFLPLSFMLLFLYAYPPVSNFLVKNLENQYPKYDYTHDVKYIHVLGNDYNLDPMQPLSSQLASTSMKRDVEGIIIHRSMMLFKSLGMNPIAAPTNYYKEEDLGYFDAPNIDSFKASEVAIHEYLGILWAKLQD